MWLHQTTEKSSSAQKQEEYCRDRNHQCPASAEVLRKNRQGDLIGSELSTDRWENGIHYNPSNFLQVARSCSSLR